MDQQKPSIGRIVHYQSLGSAPGAIEYDSAPTAAIITDVLSEIDAQTVSLCVLYPNGFSFKQEVDFSEKPEPGYWNWPPRV